MNSILTILYFCLLANTTVYSSCPNGDIRLVGDSTDNNVNVQICYKISWGSVCYYSWGTLGSIVVC